MELWQKYGSDVAFYKDDKKMTYRQIARKLEEKYGGKFSGAKARRYFRTWAKNTNYGREEPEREEFPRSEPGIQDRIEGNTRTVEVDGHSQIRTVEDLVDAANIDLDNWNIVDQKVKTWNGFHKNASKETVVVQLFSIAIKLLPKEVEPVSPVIHPVNINVSNKPRPSNVANMSHLQVALVLFDPHFGFERDLYNEELVPMHDRKALDLAWQVAEYYKPNQIIVGGDLLDLPNWSSRWTPDPGFIRTTQLSLVEAGWYLNILKSMYDDTDMYVLEGNHDARLMDLQKASMSEAYGLKAVDEMHLPPALSLPRLLSLHKNDIEFIEGYPTNSVAITDDLYVMHGHKVRSGATATVKALLQDSTVSIIHGHTHRSEHAAKNYYNGNGSETVEVWSSGCLCHTDGRIPGSNRQHDWQQGFMLVIYDEEYQHPPEIIDVKVHNGYCSINGKRFFAEESEYMNLLQSDTGIDF